MSLPFQATECYLANVLPSSAPSRSWKAPAATPSDDSAPGWSQEAASCVEQLLCNKVVEAAVSHYAPDQIPAVRFYTTVAAPDGHSVSTDIASVLVEEGHAVISSPSNPPPPRHPPRPQPLLSTAYRQPLPIKG